MTRKNGWIGVLAASMILQAAGWTRAEDWPQWRGPNRDGISAEKGLLKEWPQEGPRLIWRVEHLGSGYGTPSVSGGIIYLMCNQGLQDEFVKALRAKDGAQIWSTRIGKVGNPDQKPNFPAARSTPTVDGKRVYALGSDGDLACLDASTGKVLWQKSLRTDFNGLPPTWAYAESPLVDGDRVLATPGGKEATIVALDKNNGTVLWKSALPEGDMAGYASLVIAGTGSVKQYVAYTAGGLVGVDAGTGKFLWRYDKTKGAMGMSMLTPVSREGFVFSGAGRVGGGLIRLKADPGGFSAEEVYAGPGLPTAIGGAVLVGDYLYGSNQNILCVEFKTGRARWTERSIAPASMCYADGRLYLHGEGGDVALLEATPEGYRERGRFSPPGRPEHGNPMEKSWAYPILAHGKLYIRDLNVLWCYDVMAVQ